MADLEVVVTEGPSLAAQVEEAPDVFVNVAIPPPVEVVEVQVPGPAGPPGMGTTYTHTQNLASDTWTVDHMLGRRPAAVSIIDTGGNEVEGEIQHTSVNQFLALFGTAFSGEVLYI